MKILSRYFLCFISLLISIFNGLSSYHIVQYEKRRKMSKNIFKTLISEKKADEILNIIPKNTEKIAKLFFICFNFFEDLVIDLLRVFIYSFYFLASILFTIMFCLDLNEDILFLSIITIISLFTYFIEVKNLNKKLLILIVPIIYFILYCYTLIRSIIIRFMAFNYRSKEMMKGVYTILGFYFSFKSPPLVLIPSLLLLVLSIGDIDIMIPPMFFKKYMIYLLNNTKGCQNIEYEIYATKYAKYFKCNPGKNLRCSVKTKEIGTINKVIVENVIQNAEYGDDFKKSFSIGHSVLNFYFEKEKGTDEYLAFITITGNSNLTLNVRIKGHLLENLFQCLNWYEINNEKGILQENRIGHCLQFEEIIELIATGDYKFLVTPIEECNYENWGDCEDFKFLTVLEGLKSNVVKTLIYHNKLFFGDDNKTGILTELLSRKCALGCKSIGSSVYKRYCSEVNCIIEKFTGDLKYIKMVKPLKNNEKFESFLKNIKKIKNGIKVKGEKGSFKKDLIRKLLVTGRINFNFDEEKMFVLEDDTIIMRSSKASVLKEYLDVMKKTRPVDSRNSTSELSRGKEEFKKRGEEIQQNSEENLKEIIVDFSKCKTFKDALLTVNSSEMKSCCDNLNLTEKVVPKFFVSKEIEVVTKKADLIDLFNRKKMDLKSSQKEKIEDYLNSHDMSNPDNLMELKIMLNKTRKIRRTDFELVENVVTYRDNSDEIKKLKKENELIIAKKEEGLEKWNKFKNVSTISDKFFKKIKNILANCPDKSYIKLENKFDVLSEITDQKSGGSGYEDTKENCLNKSLKFELYERMAEKTDPITFCKNNFGKNFTKKLINNNIDFEHKIQNKSKFEIINKVFKNVLCNSISTSNNDLEKRIFKKQNEPINKQIIKRIKNWGNFVKKNFPMVMTGQQSSQIGHDFSKQGNRRDSENKIVLLMENCQEFKNFLECLKVIKEEEITCRYTDSIKWFYDLSDNLLIKIPDKVE